MTPRGVSMFLTARNITGVSRCVVFPGSEDPCCSCSWSTRGSTSLALFPPTPECSSSSFPVGNSQFVRRVLLCQSSDACIVPPPDAVLFRTTRYVNEVRRGVVFPRLEDPCCSCSFLMRGGTLTALIPPTLVDSGTGGVSDINRLQFRYIRLGRMSVCVRKCRRIHSQLRESDTRPVMFRTTKPDHQWFRKKRQRRMCCLVLLCSSASPRESESFRSLLR